MLALTALHNVTIKAGKTIASVRWDFEDDSYSDQAEPVHAYHEAGHYGVTVRATFADGGRGIDVVFVQVETPEDRAGPLVEADFEDATRQTHWGYQCKFYRPRQTGSVHTARPDGPGKCMRLFYDSRKQNRTAGQVAPGVWDIDRYPYIRLDYRIPEGVPVALTVEPFTAPGRPAGLVLAGTQNRSVGSYTGEFRSRQGRELRIGKETTVASSSPSPCPLPPRERGHRRVL